jgi:hypothetical protein
MYRIGRTPVFFLVILLLISIATSYAQTTPSEKKSPQPIILDKTSYTWTDKVRIKIIAPDWNISPSTKDVIGDKEGEFVKVATRDYKLKPYKLIETEPNSGEFVGHVKLTGFAHDVDGDKKIDTNPQTSGVGPFDGLLQTKRGDGLTVTFESGKKVYSSATAQIRWNVGEVSLDNTAYFIDDVMKITVKDPDMNLNPDSLDVVTLTISSNTDPSGFKIQAQETNNNSAVFVAHVSFSLTKTTALNKLHVIPPDTIYIKYRDRTLPSPYSTTDVLLIEKNSLFRDPTPMTSRIEVSNNILKNRIGTPVIEPKIGQQVEITADVQNKQNYEQEFVYLVQILDENKVVTKLSWLEGKLQPYQKLQVGKLWLPEEVGVYLVETYVWKSLKYPVAISEQISNIYEVVKN